MANIQQSFIPQHSKLTDRQFEAIGRVTAHWAVLEFMLESLLVRLAMAPHLPGLALTNNLNIDNRLGALRSLIFIHMARYRGNGMIPHDVLQELESLPATIAKLKDRRNKTIHYVWFRDTDEKLYGHKFKGMQAKDDHQTIAIRVKAKKESPDDYEDGPSIVCKVASLMKFADRIEALADQIFQLEQRIPEIDEVWLVRSLSQGKHRPRSDIQSEH